MSLIILNTILHSSLNWCQFENMRIVFKVISWIICNIFSYIHYYLNTVTAIFSVHVRRTDKLKAEASFHAIEEYMAHVDDYYNLLEKRQHVDKRRIFLASDDPSVLQEAVTKFVNYLCFITITTSKTISWEIYLIVLHLS